jgi:hypothetical protein
MKWKNTPDYVITVLEPILRHVYGVAEASVTYSLGRFEKEKESLENYFHADTIRYKIRTALEKDQKLYGYQVKQLSNFGIEIVFQEYSIKIVKGRDKLPPPSGRSRKRRDFYKQKHFQPSLFGLAHELHQAKNLVITWNTTRAGSFLSLELACTKDVAQAYKSPILYWTAEIQHPANTQQTTSNFSEPIDELDEIRRQEDVDFDELDIFKPKTGTDD